MRPQWAKIKKMLIEDQSLSEEEADEMIVEGKEMYAMGESYNDLLESYFCLGVDKFIELKS